MTRDELLTTLSRIKENEDFDFEVAHMTADGALVEFIDDEEIAKAYDAIPKWYA